MKRFINALCLCLFISGVFSVTFARYPIVWMVAKVEPRDFSTIQAALDNPMLQSGDDILIGSGTYTESILINNKTSITLMGLDDPGIERPQINVPVVIRYSDDIVFENIKFKDSETAIDGFSYVPSKSLEIRNCEFTRTSQGGTGVDIRYNATITNCSFYNYTTGIFLGVDEYGSRNINVDECTFENADYGVALWGTPLSAGKTIDANVNNNNFKNCGGIFETACVFADSRADLTDPDDDIAITVRMTGNTFEFADPNAFNAEHFGMGKNITWITQACESCPTYFQTPNYPSNYSNNLNIDAVLNAPSGSGYNVVVNGVTEYINDYLNIREMDGTLIAQFSGQKSNYKVWIDSDRSVKVEFLSNASISFEGYKVTVESDWTAGVSYDVDDVVNYSGEMWLNNFAHTSQVDWFPGAPGLWFWEVLAGSQPPVSWTTNVWYVVGDEVIYNSETWECIYSHTSQAGWYPGAPGVFFWQLKE